MSSLRAILTAKFSRAFEKQGLDPSYGKVVDSQRPELGQFQCNGALAAAKEARKNPRAIAQAVVEQLSSDPCIDSLSLAGPGFINIALSDAFLAEHISRLAEDERLGSPLPAHPHVVVVDFCGPNVAKPMHVGHLRPTIIGDALQRLMRYLGETVITDNHLGDWGTNMGILINAMRERRPDLPYFDPEKTRSFPEEPPMTVEELEKLYPEATAECKSDPAKMQKALDATYELQNGRPGFVALWKHFVNLSMTELKGDLEKLGVRFDYWLGESFYHGKMGELVDRLETEGKAVDSEGALVVHVAREDDKREIPPLLLRKRGGGYLYGTSDLATLDYRVHEFGAEEIIYVVDQRQELHFEQVFRAARRTGIAAENVSMIHIGFGTVNGKDGRPFRTREGGAARLSYLLAEATEKAMERMDEAGVGRDFDKAEKADVAHKVGLAALKFADLMNHRTSDYVFDIDKFTRFEGKTGPYLLYSAVRIKSILRNAAERGVTTGPLLPPTDAERGLMLLLGKLPDVLAGAREGFAPNYMCDFIYDLAQEFNRFYRDCHILREPDEARRGSWLSLVNIVLAELELVLGLLGMEIPERM
ncbi:MAG: arginine--tRNA ligase [Chitinivibrionales bacterium]|nr:arginine--tRNA ligase [Chitinivibrionales bacterium]MBD3357824.1 arginine--tRNA ligase [Chitinivibrionales bacterium]